MERLVANTSLHTTALIHATAPIHANASIPAAAPAARRCLFELGARATMTTHAVRICASVVLCLLAGCEFGVEVPPDGTRQPSRTGSQAWPGGGVARGGLRFVESYEQGCRQAAREGKPIFLFFTASWCHFCHQMAEEAFTHPQVVSLSERFVCILVDADAQSEVCQHYQVCGYPTVVFVSPRGVALERVVGKKPGHQLLMAMQSALQHVARRELSAERVLVR